MAQRKNTPALLGSCLPTYKVKNVFGVLLQRMNNIFTKKSWKRKFADKWAWFVGVLRGGWIGVLGR